MAIIEFIQFIQQIPFFYFFIFFIASIVITSIFTSSRKRQWIIPFMVITFIVFAYPFLSTIQSDIDSNFNQSQLDINITQNITQNITTLQAEELELVILTIELEDDKDILNTEFLDLGGLLS